MTQSKMVGRDGFTVSAQGKPISYHHVPAGSLSFILINRRRKAKQNPPFISNDFFCSGGLRVQCHEICELQFFHIFLRNPLYFKKDLANFSPFRKIVMQSKFNYLIILFVLHRAPTSHQLFMQTFSI